MIGDVILRNNFYRFIKGCVGFKIYSAIFCLIILPIITIYQLIVSLFVPCFYNVLILLVQYLLLIGLLVWTLFC